MVKRMKCMNYYDIVPLCRLLSLQPMLHGKLFKCTPFAHRCDTSGLGPMDKVPVSLWHTITITTHKHQTCLVSMLQLAVVAGVACTCTTRCTMQHAHVPPTNPERVTIPEAHQAISEHLFAIICHYDGICCGETHIRLVPCVGATLIMPCQNPVERTLSGHTSYRAQT